MTTSTHRRICKGIRKLADGIKVEVLRSHRHIILALLRPGAVPCQITVSNTPKNPDHAVLNAIEDARKALGIPKKANS